jgi:MFS family permease
LAQTVPTLGLLAQPRFRRLAGAKLLQLLGQNALIYGLFILVVARYESAFATALFVLAASIPSILFGPFGGVVADALPHKTVILITMALRAATVVPFILYDPGLILIVAFTALVWTVYQFFSPAENAALPSVAPRHQITAANSLLNGISIVAQLGGAGLIAPVAVKLLGANGLFVIVIVLFAGAFLLYAGITGLTSERVETKRTSWIASLPDGLRAIRGNDALSRVTTLLILMDVALVVVVVAAPTFIQRVLFTASANAVYIFAPGALGVAIGLLAAPLLVRFLPAKAVVTLGYILVIAVLLALPFVRPLALALDDWTFLPFAPVQDYLNIRPAIAMTAVLVPFAGFGMTLVRVATRTVVYEVAPPGHLAQVFATQSSLGSLASLPPTLLAGLLIDLIGVRPVLVLTGVIVAVLAFRNILKPGRLTAVGRVSAE